MKTRRWPSAIALLLALGAISPGCGSPETGDPLSALPGGDKVTLRFFRDPTVIPSITLTDLDGRSISSNDWRGKVTIVNFWATWCPPCRAEIPDLVALQKKYGDRLQIIGVSQDEGPVEPVKRFAAEHQINYPIVMMTPDLERVFSGIRALPTSFVLDREVRVVQRHVGMLNAAMTEQETRSLAGLPVNASIEQIDRGQPARLENAAQATEIPGVDLAHLSPAKRTAALQKLNTDPCTCGCENTLAKCRIDDPKCTTSLPLAQKVVQDIAAE